jgi:multiple sugar transport system substrate-binding protein
VTKRHSSAWLASTLVLCASLLLAGQVGSAAPAAAQIQVAFWHMETPPHRVAAFQRVIDEFNASRPGVRVRQETVSWGDVNQKLMSAITSGSQPDFTFVSDTLGAAVWETRTLQPVDDLVKEIDRRHGMIRANVAPFVHHGNTWAVPMFTLSHLFYYRKDLAAQAGLTGPIKTWGDLTRMMTRLRQIRPDMAGIALPASKHKFTQQSFYDFMITNGATIFDSRGRVALNNPRTIEALTTYTQLLQYSVPDKASLEWAGAELVFATGRAASMFFYGSLFTQVETSGLVGDKFTAVLPPVPDHGRGRVGATNSHNAIVMFTSDRAKQQAIADFILFWMEPDRYGRFLAEAEPGLYIPVTKAGMESQSFWRHPLIAKYRPMILLGIEATRTENSYNIGIEPRTPFNARAGVIEGSLVLADVVQKVAFGGMTPAQAAKWGEEQIRWLMSE